VKFRDVSYVDQRTERSDGGVGVFLADQELVKVVDRRVELVGRRDLVDDRTEDETVIDQTSEVRDLVSETEEN